MEHTQGMAAETVVPDLLELQAEARDAQEVAAAEAQVDTPALEELEVILVTAQLEQVAVAVVVRPEAGAVRESVPALEAV